MYQQALALNEELGSKAGMANNLGNMGIVQYDRHNLVKAKELLEQSMALFREIGAQRKMKQVQGWLDRLPKSDKGAE